MNENEQRIAIAEACGWSNVKIYSRIESNKRHSEDTEPIAIGCRHAAWGAGACSVPNYLNDLNAMHEAEKMLGDGRNTWGKYCDLLGGSLYHCAHATAAQRAEAFLKTLNLWKP